MCTVNNQPQTSAFKEKLKKILKEQNIPVSKFCEDLGLDRSNFFCRKKSSNGHKPHVYMAIAYYFGVDVEELLADTDALNDFYGC